MGLLAMVAYSCGSNDTVVDENEETEEVVLEEDMDMDMDEDTAEYEETESTKTTPAKTQKTEAVIDAKNDVVEVSKEATNAKAQKARENAQKNAETLKETVKEAVETETQTFERKKK